VGSLFDDLALLAFAVGFLAMKEIWMAVDFSSLNDQVDHTLTVMSDAVAVIQSDVRAFADAHSANDAAVVVAIAARLKQGTDTWRLLWLRRR
jgi:class 3 adenylate cyclase